MRYLLALVCCICAATVSAQDFVWKTDLNSSKENHEKLSVKITGDSAIELKFAAETFSRVFAKPGSDASVKWIATILADTAGVASSDSITEALFSNYRLHQYNKNLAERVKACSAGLIFCRQYSLTPSGKYSLMLLSYDNSRLTIDYELAGESATYQCLSTTASTIKTILSANTASLKIADEETTSLDSIAAVFSEEFAKYQSTQEAVAVKQAQIDDLRSVVQDMTVIRDTAFTVFLGAPGATTLPKQIKMYTCTFGEAHRLSSRKKRADLDAMYSTPKSKKDSSAGKQQVTMPLQKTLSVDSAFLSFSSYTLATVRIYTHENTPEQTPHVFTNSRPLSIASPRSLEYTRNALLREEIITKGGMSIPVIYLKDVLSFDPGKGGFITDYIPRDTNIILRSKHLSQPVRKPSPASLFRVGIFTDLSGFLDSEAPNGKFQTEVTCIIPMRSRGARIPFMRGRSFTWLKTIVPEICVSKLGDDNRLLLVNVDTTSNIAHVNHFNVFQYVNFWGGGRINLFAIEDRNLNSSCWVNFRFRYMRTQFADTLYNRDRIFTGLSVFYETEIYYKRKMTRNFAIDLSVSAGVIKMYDNSVALSYSTIYGDKRDNVFRPLAALRLSDPDFFKELRSRKVTDRLIVTPMMIIKYTKRDSKANGAFIRISFPNSFNNNNGFLMAQVGYIRPFESLFRSGGSTKN